MKIALVGPRGRMGQAILQCAAAVDCEIVAEIGREAGLSVVGCDAIIDFSVAERTVEIAEIAAHSNKPLIIGTTGHTQEQRQRILAHVGHIPIVWSGNFSIGVNLLFYLTHRAAGILGNDFNPEIVEVHHQHKKDAPGGTAERLIDIIQEARGLKDEHVTHGRYGIVGPRPVNEIGVHALRGGDVVGEHTVYFAGPGERIELTHRASDRGIFAHGALRAAKWAVAQPPGLYSMEDVLGFAACSSGARAAG